MSSKAHVKKFIIENIYQKSCIQLLKGQKTKKKFKYKVILDSLTYIFRAQVNMTQQENDQRKLTIIIQNRNQIHQFNLI